MILYKEYQLYASCGIVEFGFHLTIYLIIYLIDYVSI